MLTTLQSLLGSNAQNLSSILLNLTHSNDTFENGSVSFATIPSSIEDDYYTDDEDSFQCYGASEAEMEIFSKVSFWTEAVLQIGISSAGFIANSFAIPILCR